MSSIATHSQSDGTTTITLTLAPSGATSTQARVNLVDALMGLAQRFEEHPSSVDYDLVNTIGRAHQ